MAPEGQNLYPEGQFGGLRMYQVRDERSGISRYQIEATDAQSMEFEARALDDYYRQFHAHMTKPHRHSFYQVLWFRNPGSHFVDFKEYRFEGDAIFFIAKDQIHYFEEDAVPDGLLLHFNTAYLGAALAAKESAFLFHLFDSFYRSPMVLPGSRDLREMSALLRLIAEEYLQPRTNAGNDVIMCLLSALLMLGYRCKAEAEEPHDNKREAGLFLEFKWHLEQDFTKTHNVAHYASLLAVSPQRLSDVCRLSAGVSAKTMISERVILEAKRYLCYSKLPVSEIAARVGYGDSLYFSRVFKQHTGMSPRAFRASLNSSPRTTP
jgi:AraC-like DNA-binding protein